MNDKHVQALHAHALRRRSRCKLEGDAWQVWDTIINECTPDTCIKEVRDSLLFLGYMKNTPRRQRDIYLQLAKDIKEGIW